MPWNIRIDFTGPYMARDVQQTYPGHPNGVIIGGGVLVQCLATKVEWKDAANNGLPLDKGVYVVENGGLPVYAGQAVDQTIAGRYAGKAAAVHELGLSQALSPTMNNAQNPQQIWAGVVSSWQGTRRPQAINMVEHWLIRYLLIRDYSRHQQNRQPQRVFLNNKKTDQGVAPTAGMTLNFSAPNGPAFLWDRGLKDLSNPRRRVANGNANQFSYTYAPNAPF